MVGFHSRIGVQKTFKTKYNHAVPLKRCEASLQLTVYQWKRGF